MKKINNTLIATPLLALLMFSFTGVAVADTVVRTGETVSVSESESVVGDFYTAAGVLNVSGQVEGDLTAAGGTATINGSVTEDVMVLGGNVDVHGPIGDDLRVIAGEVVIAEPVTGDVFAVGATVSILSTASVGGDILVFGGEVTIESPVGGDIIGYAESMRIDAPVAGNVDVTVPDLVLGDRAAIEGTVRYVSENLVTRSPNASVGGEIVRNDPVYSQQAPSSKDVLVPLLTLLFTVLVWFLVARQNLTKIVRLATEKRARPILLGFAVFFLAPFAIIVLMVSVLGILVGFIAFLGYLLLILLSIIAMVAVAGQLLLRLFNQPAEDVTLYTIAAGIVGVFLIALVPLIGAIVLLGLFFHTYGTLLESFFLSKHPS